jgi:hypothetical protein
MIESQTFYDGSIDMVFEPRKHQYFVGDDQVPSDWGYVKASTTQVVREHGGRLLQKPAQPRYGVG